MICLFSFDRPATKLRQYILCIMALFSGILLFGQQQVPIDTADYANRASLKELLTKKYELMSKSFKKEYKGDTRKMLTSDLESFREQFFQSIDEKEFIFDHRFTAFVTQLETEIKAKLGAELKEHFTMYTSISTRPNAFCTIDGSIVLHQGLFQFLDNEDQLMAIICHEIAHNELKHPRNSLIKRAKTASSKTYKNRISKIRNKKVDRNTRAFKLLKDLIYSQSEEKRHREMEADSLGYVLFQKLTKNSYEYINALSFLKAIDSLPSINIVPEDYEAIFSNNSETISSESISSFENSLFNLNSFGYPLLVNADTLIRFFTSSLARMLS